MKPIVLLTFIISGWVSAAVMAEDDKPISIVSARITALLFMLGIPKSIVAALFSRMRAAQAH